MERLQKYLANAGVASRRKSEELILQGKISVNDTIIKEMGYKVNKNDVIKYNNKIIKSNKEFIYIILNKPVNYITSVKDQFDRKTVMDLIDITKKIVPVGRLDYDTSGLLLLTNDGDLTYKITHPKNKIGKTYKVKIIGNLNMTDLQKIRRGFSIDNYKTAPAKVKILDFDNIYSNIELTIYEGKNRQIRNMLEHLNHKVVKLQRISIGDISLDDLPLGKYRHLTNKEINYLKKL